MSQLDIIAVGAHPDDIEIACGGTLAALVKQGYSVGIIDLTDGEPTPLSENPDVRHAEAAAAAETLGVQRWILDLPNRKLFDGYTARVALATQFRKLRPRLVIGLAGRTPMASPDHWQARQITDAAVFYSRLTKWDDEFDGTAPHKIASQLYCRLSFETDTSQLDMSKFVMDISDTLETKLAAIRCYKTQFPPAKEYVFERVEAVSRYVGAMAGVKAGEEFYSPQALVTRDVFSLVDQTR